MNARVYLKKAFPGFEPDWYGEAAAAGILTSYHTEQMIMGPGDTDQFALLVVSGNVKVYGISADGTEYFMYFLHPGQACALSLQCENIKIHHKVAIRSMPDAVTIKFPAEKVKEWLQKYSNWHLFVMQTYLLRLDDLLDALDHITFRQLDDRLTDYLEKQSAVTGANIYITHQDIAKDLNSSREVISRLLKKLEDRGMVKLHRRYLEWLSRPEAGKEPA